MPTLVTSVPSLIAELNSRADSPKSVRNLNEFEVSLMDLGIYLEEAPDSAQNDSKKILAA